MFYMEWSKTSIETANQYDIAHLNDGYLVLNMWSVVYGQCYAILGEEL